MDLRVKNFFVGIFILCFSVLLSSCTTTRLIKAPDGVESVIYDSADVSSSGRQQIYHSVAPGETLWRIAKMYDVDIATLKKINRIRDVRDIDIGKKISIPNAASRKDLITLYPSQKWDYIIIHHSATEKGNSMEFNKAHLKRGWQGVGYQFIIDNGTCEKENGQIESSPRWIKQTKGAHCNVNGMNKRGIGICLVGNFSKDGVSSKQMDSLVYLVKKLSKYYRIPYRNIMGHSQVPGAQTECPGTKFPWKEFWRKLKR